MLYLPNYAGALRCIGQALQNESIEVFELRTHLDEFRLQGGDPNPPYIALIELRFSIEDIKILDREGQARRRQSNAGYCLVTNPSSNVGTAIISKQIKNAPAVAAIAVLRDVPCVIETPVPASQTPHTANGFIPFSTVPR